MPATSPASAKGGFRVRQKSLFATSVLACALSLESCGGADFSSTLNGLGSRPELAVSGRIAVQEGGGADASRQNVPALKVLRSFRLTMATSGLQFVQPSAIVGGPEGQTLYVLDRRTMDVLEVDSDGSARPALRRDQQSTFRLRVPHSLVPLPDSQLAVADRTREIKLFRVVGRELVGTSLVTAGDQVVGLCSLTDRLVVKGYGASGR